MGRDQERLMEISVIVDRGSPGYQEEVEQIIFCQGKLFEEL